MQLLRRAICAAALLTLGGIVSAAPVAPKEGVQYKVLPQKMDTPAGKQVEVIEFFAYSCPHCNVFEPVLAAWVKKQGDNIAFKRVHVAAGQRALPQLRLFATLEAPVMKTRPAPAAAVISCPLWLFPPVRPSPAGRPAAVPVRTARHGCALRPGSPSTAK